MINPSELVELVVGHLKAIPALVREMGDDADRIYPYHDSYPENVSLPLALHRMPTPAIMVAWTGSGPAMSGDFQVWQHQVNLYLRSKLEDVGGVPAGYYRLYRLIVKGIPSDAEQSLIYRDLHPGCYPAELPMIQRQTDAEALDYFEVPLTFKEIGDDV